VLVVKVTRGTRLVVLVLGKPVPKARSGIISTAVEEVELAPT